MRRMLIVLPVRMLVRLIPVLLLLLLLLLVLVLVDRRALVPKRTGLELMLCVELVLLLWVQLP